MAKLPQDFADLLIELCEADVEFLLVGGWAVILYGHVRATDDMAILVRPSQMNSERVVSALAAFGAPLQAHGVASQHFAAEGDAYRFGMTTLKVEILTKISGVSFDEALQGSKAFELDGYRIPYIGRLALIRNKKAAGRHKDLADVEELERLDEDLGAGDGLRARPPRNARTSRAQRGLTDSSVAALQAARAMAGLGAFRLRDT